MLKPSLPVASRTRSRVDAQLMKDYRERKRRNTGTTKVVEVRVPETGIATPSSSTKGNDSLGSKKDTEGIKILYEYDAGCSATASFHHLGNQEDDDDDDDDDDDEEEEEDEYDDEDLTSTSGEDNDESEDLDYYVEDSEPEKCQSSSGSDDDGIICSNVSKSSDTKSKLKSKSKVKKAAATTSNQVNLRKIADDILSNAESEALKVETENDPLPPKFSSGGKDTISPQSADSVDEMEQLRSEMQDCQTKNDPMPPNFSFGGKDTISPQSTDSVDEMEEMWKEMQLYLASKEIGSTQIPQLVTEDAASSLCRDGDHQLVLDEEIGLKCRFCSFLQLEIKYVVSPFMKRPCGKSEKYYSGDEDYNFDGLQDQGPDDDMPDYDSSADIKGTVWEIIPGIKSTLYPHQRQGFEFLWNNIAGGIHRDKSKNSSEGVGGCIISHAPGTGKTLLTILFLKTYVHEYPNCRPVIVAPRSMLLTWEAEFEKWNVDIPIHNLNSKDFSGKEEAVQNARYMKLKNDLPYVDRHRARHLVKLHSWKTKGGILVIGYDLLKKLAGKETRRKQTSESIYKLIRKIILNLPGLVVLDEGHIPRNAGTHLWKVLSRIKTDHRIILSGTPFQNNCDELFNTLSLVRPKFAEGICCTNRYKENKRGGCKGNEAKRTWSSWTDSIGNNDDRLREVRAVIKPFVHVYKDTILKTALPGLRQFLVVLRPTDLQKKIMERVDEILELVEEANNHSRKKRAKEKKNALDLDRFASFISVHPSLLKLVLRRLSDQKDINEVVSSGVSMKELERIRLKPDEGVKTKFLMNLLKLSEALEEKVIVFSQYLGPLRLIMLQLKDQFKWREGESEEILFMHGKCDLKQRQRSINAFNVKNSKARVLLASTKACCEGINLIGGSRVVLLDVTWNPSVEKQATSRAYRLGQEKVVHIYHLISSGTEESKYCRQAGKERISELLFPSSDKGDDHHQQVYNIVEDKVLEEMFQNETLKPMFKKIINEPKRLCIDSNFEHQ